MKKKLLIFIVAYNHEKTIENVVKRIPKMLCTLQYHKSDDVFYGCPLILIRLQFTDGISIAL